MPLQPRKSIPHPTDPSLAIVPLTKGYFATVSVVDAALAGSYLWVAKAHGPLVYAARSSPRDRHVSRLHRLIADAMGIPRDASVDHINGNGLDCRRSNLRAATQSQQLCNTRIRSDNASGVKGVSYRADKAKWRAFIGAGYRFIHLGEFATKEEAIAARKAAEPQYHGDFVPSEDRTRRCH